MTSSFERRARDSCSISASRGRFFVMRSAAVENALQRTVLVHQIACGLVADAWNTRNVVRGIADESQIVDHALGRDAEPLAGVRETHPLFLDARRTAASGIEEPHARA